MKDLFSLGKRLDDNTEILIGAALATPPLWGLTLSHDCAWGACSHIVQKALANRRLNGERTPKQRGASCICVILLVLCTYIKACLRRLLNMRPPTSLAPNYGRRTSARRSSNHSRISRPEETSKNWPAWHREIQLRAALLLRTY